ncbi:MAG: carboxymethylenebutenolidase [Gammaproteobacteria bacterium]|nr:MAG: carboxymethylenebutenolidase [Gammaproteobacteria bacterium]
MPELQLVSKDGHEFSAYESSPVGKVKGSVVIIQEIFGVNAHIQSVVEFYAGEGYYAIAPALFDRCETGVALGYDAQGMQKGIQLVTKLKPKNTMADIAAAAFVIKQKYPETKSAIVGYCFGGTMAWLSASALDSFSCAVGYYGGQIASFADQTPQCPTLLHFAGDDAHIPLADVEKVRSAQPQVKIEIYSGAKHGFNCDARSDYQQESSDLAKRRSLDFLAEHL